MGGLKRSTQHPRRRDENHWINDEVGVLKQEMDGLNSMFLISVMRARILKKRLGDGRAEKLTDVSRFTSAFQVEKKVHKKTQPQGCAGGDFG